MSGSLLESLDVFYGELTPARATVYARLEGLESTDGLSLSGFVRGPRCFYSKTLPASFRLQDAGPGPSLLAKSLVPDPSYWSPDTPHIYDVTVELRKGADIIASEVRQIGFKPLGISGRSFTWEGKPWVLRGVQQTSTVETDLLAWKQHAAVLVGLPRSDELRTLSERGVLVYCMLAAETERLQSELRRAARFPAVFAYGTCYRERGKSLARLVPNVLLFFYPLHPTDGFPEWTHFGHATSADAISHAEFMRELDVPIVVQNWHARTSIADARSACDKLQAYLAPIGQFAGYIV